MKRKKKKMKKKKKKKGKMTKMNKKIYLKLTIKNALYLIIKKMKQ